MSNQMMEQFVKHLQSEFETSLVGELNCFLGLHVKKMGDIVSMSQSKYATSIVKKSRNENGRHVKDDNIIDDDQRVYRSKYAKLVFPTTGRPGITFLKGVFDIYQAKIKDGRLIQGKIAHERELRIDALGSNEIIVLLEKADLMNTILGISRCYDRFVKNIFGDCPKETNKEFRKVFDRGK